MTAAERREAVKNGKPFNRLDIALFSLVALIVALIALFVFFPREEAVSVAVTTKGGETRYSLKENAEIDVGGHLTLVIEDGKAYVKDADCPDKVCEHTGRISRVGQMIACLPSGIVITVTGESDFVEVG